ncbi:hypothetical protein [Streptomyces brevispora]|uniref:Immunity protein 53 of polymorphic toxin system n=1 Tax=Streptomyces brevispora TaxID=887462 RepID=A0ABZ1G4F5_9ACTN|nr:hypothetical protein [Streptomyces brevispora]WSC14783.1 hypothetical protein OIE64_19385 [Streptomyces brevispora]
MDHVVDLDSAAAEITARLSAWSAAGLAPCPITWRDGLAPWPQPLETDRTRVSDPDSIGLRIQGSDGWAELHLVLYREGWADLDALADDEVLTEGPSISNPEEFGRFLDSTVMRFLGTAGSHRDEAR